ncbi:hypothetical protein BDV24DRAFT_126229 [Aspergillus arachidicola]|uniref:Uncharacterized protein n=1 Tax=Aspergillus arachidicola TaxID=656916 RepID=A0A5N6YHY7_9EURO|nr:hypothetical protein BDV24DRAFT_126229 [Aspergillus arachidicola]
MRLIWALVAFGISLAAANGIDVRDSYISSDLEKKDPSIDLDKRGCPCDCNNMICGGNCNGNCDYDLCVECHGCCTWA